MNGPKLTKPFQEIANKYNDDWRKGVIQRELLIHDLQLMIEKEFGFSTPRTQFILNENKLSGRFITDALVPLQWHCQFISLLPD